MRIHDPNYLKLYFPLNGPAADYSGNNWPVTGDTITDFIDGPFGRQIPVFNGTDTQVEFAEGMEHPFNWDGFTISFWIKRSDLLDGNAKGVYSYATTTGDNQTGFEIRVATDGGVIFASYPGDSQGANLDVLNIPYYHLLNIVLCFRASDRSTEWWINGNLVQISTKSAPIVAGGENHRLGVRAALSSWFTGSIWNFRLYNTILTPEEIKQLHFHEQTNKKAVIAPELPLTVKPDVSDPTLQVAFLGKDPLVDQSMYGRGITLSKSSADYVNLKGGGIRKYNAANAPVGDQLSLSTLPNFASYTICFWWKGTAFNADNRRIWISSVLNTNQFVQQSTTSLRWTVNDGVTGDDSIDVPSTLGSWQHIACVFDKVGSIRHVYVNGALSGSRPLPEGFLSPDYISPSFLSAEAEGDMKDVRIYSRVLSAAEIKSIADSSNPEPDLILHTNDGLKDLSIINHTLTPTGLPIELGNGFKSGFSLSPDTSSYVEAENKGYWTDMDLTFSFWMKVFDEWTESICLIARHSLSTGNFALSVQRGNRIFRLSWQDGSLTIPIGFSNPRLFSWCHYVIRAKRNGINRVYINGELAGSHDYTGMGSPTNNSSFLLGNYNTTAVQAGSYHIKDFRVYTGEKSAEWVKNYYLKTKDAY